MQETLEKKQIKNIDFNCDLAQSFGLYKNNAECELLDYVSSVNISCGFHAGDPMIIKNALLKAKEKNITVITMIIPKSNTQKKYCFIDIEVLYSKIVYIMNRINIVQ